MREQDFAALAARRRDGNVVTEFWHLLWRTRKWWLAPLVIVLLVFGLMIWMGGTAAAPFIYTLF